MQFINANKAQRMKVYIRVSGILADASSYELMQAYAIQYKLIQVNQVHTSSYKLIQVITSPNKLRSAGASTCKFMQQNTI